MHNVINNPLIPKNTYYILFSLLGIVYILELFVPLMDNDSAHHANIALRMHLTGDYINLIDYEKDYLDKPHLHFWLAAFSYKLFGVTGFAYKLPSFLFTILGTYSTYRLGKSLYNADIGKLAALIIASAFAYILANNDVRMDAILTAAAALATWKLVELIQHKRITDAIIAALGLAIGFSTKGHIGILVPVIAAFFYIAYKKDWLVLLNWKLLSVLFFFALFISPVVYCYYLQYNVHPEKVIRGRDNINGISFILFGQSVERFSGGLGTDSKNDYFFFLHSFLWAFAPWSILAYLAMGKRLKKFKESEWATPSVFIIVLLIVSFSGFKLPHYLNIVFPTTAVLLANFLNHYKEDLLRARKFYLLQLLLSCLLLLIVGIITFWAFPIQKLYIIPGVILFLSVYFYFLKTTTLTYLQKSITLSVSTMILCFFLLNANFYPQLLKYQGGNELARATKGKVDPANVYYWKDNFSSSFTFYTATLRKQFTDSTLKAGGKIWLLYDIRNEPEIEEAGYTIGEKFSTPDYEITKLNLKFINPARRKSQYTQMVIGSITARPAD